MADSEIAESAPAADPLVGYYEQAKRPLVCLVFILPMIGLYEFGTLATDSLVSRNGADVLMRGFLSGAGIGFHLMLPVLTCVILLAWHHLSGQRWQVRIPHLPMMGVECAVLAVALLAVAQLQRQLMVDAPAPANWIGSTAESQEFVTEQAGPWVAYLGAGIYEELLFRLMLLPVLVVAIRQFIPSVRTSVIAAVLLSSALFVAAHYQPLNPAGYPFDGSVPEFAYGVSFRFLAGIFFAVIYFARGFGIAVGTHAAYDILAHRV